MCNDCLKIKSDTPFEEWYFKNDRYRDYAVKCKELLANFGQVLKLYESRKHKTGDYVCWYFGFKDNYEERICLILRPEIQPSDISFQFQSAENVPKDTLRHGEKEKSHTNWLHVMYSGYEENELIKMIAGYLENIKKNWLDVEKHCQKRRPCERQRKEC